MKLAVIIPCLNEEKTIGNVLARVPKPRAPFASTIVIVVDDGSQDKTAEIARKAGASVVSHGINRGVGVAFSTGISEALHRGADVIVNMDGDGQFDPADMPKLVAPILDNRADFVTASRFLDPRIVPSMPTVKKWGNRRIAGLISSLIGTRFCDVSCGFRAYSRESALSLTLVGQFTYTQETFLDLAFKGFRILEVPVVVRGEREFGESRVASSIVRYAINSGKIIFRSYRDYRPLHVFGALSAWSLLAGGSLLAFLLYHYLTTGRFSGHLWAGFVGGAFTFLSVVLLLVGVVADMLDRIRLHQERILYYQKKMMYGPGTQKTPGSAVDAPR